jgi:signal transduction histidine kinase
MYIKIALFVSVLLQFIAAAYAISLIRRTKYNISWILITLGFLLMAARRFYELIHIFQDVSKLRIGLISSWIAVLISLLMFGGVIYIRRIFNIQDRIEQLRKQNESKILSAIIRTEEKARQEFSKELHDGLGPLLAGVKMSISAIDKSKIDASNLEIIGHTEQNIDEAITVVKEISNNLSPHILKNFGLHKAVVTFIERFGTIENLDIRLSSDIEVKRFDYNTEIILYRIICELIANTMKHASATKIDISLFHRGNNLELLYSDNGIGFDIEAIETSSPGMGLSSIQSRIKSLNGSIDLFSHPEEGFNLKIIVSA